MRDIRVLFIVLLIIVKHMIYVKTTDMIPEIVIDENTTTMTFPANIPVYQTEEEDEVTHEVFFGENIQRVINTLFK